MRGGAGLLSSLGMVDTGFLASADAAVHFGQQPCVHDLEEHQASLLIQHLLMCRVLFLFMKPLGLHTVLDKTNT